MQKHHAAGTARGWFGRSDENGTFPRLASPEPVCLSATLHPWGNKSSQSAETGFWGFAFMGGKMIQRLVVFSVMAWGFQSGITARWCVTLVKWKLCVASFVLNFSICTYKAQIYVSLDVCTVDWAFRWPSNHLWLTDSSSGNLVKRTTEHDSSRIRNTLNKLQAVLCISAESYLLFQPCKLMNPTWWCWVHVSEEEFAIKLHWKIFIHLLKGDSLHLNLFHRTALWCKS